jgi:hypothetical protein
MAPIALDRGVCFCAGPRGWRDAQQPCPALRSGISRPRLSSRASRPSASYRDRERQDGQAVADLKQGDFRGHRRRQTTNRRSIPKLNAKWMTATRAERRKARRANRFGLIVTMIAAATGADGLTSGCPPCFSTTIHVRARHQACRCRDPLPKFIQPNTVRPLAMINGSWYPLQPDSRSIRM